MSFKMQLWQHILLSLNIITLSCQSTAIIEANLSCWDGPIIDSISTTNDSTILYYSFTFPAAYQVAIFSTCNEHTPSFATRLTLYDANMTQISTNDIADDYCLTNKKASTLMIDNTLFPRDIYYISIESATNNSGDFGIQVNCTTITADLKCDEEIQLGSITNDKEMYLYTFMAPLYTYDKNINITFTTCNHHTFSFESRIILYDSNFNLIEWIDEDPDCDIQPYAATLHLNSDSINGNSSNNSNANLVYLFVTEYFYPYEHVFGDFGLQVICNADHNQNECNTVEGDTCYVTDLYHYCDSSYKNCVVTLEDTLLRTNISYINVTYSFFCSSTNCNKCTFNCMYQDEDSTDLDLIYFYGEDCSLVEVNIYGTVKNTAIVPPTNGTLAVNIYNGAIATQLHIMALTFTHQSNNIIFNVADGGVALWTTIYAEYIYGVLNITCNGVCSRSHIICPSNYSDGTMPRCNINCASTKPYACSTVDVYSVDGVQDVHWYGCNDNDKTACKNSRLYCEVSYDVLDEIFSTWIWDNSTGWQWENENCGELVIAGIVKTEKENDPLTIGLIAGAALLTLIFIIGAVVYYYKYQREQKTMYISNALVLLVSIGTYDQDVTQPEIDGEMRDLHGVENDIINMCDYFHNELNFDIYPMEYVPNIVNNGGINIRTHWTEHDLKQFFKEKAKYLSENILENKKYDGLIVVISCHGIPGYIMTSDYKRFSKLAIHRIFSAVHPISRNIPRVFLYDCCSGSNERIGFRQDDPFEKNEYGKLYTGTVVETSKNVEDDGQEILSWARQEHNPDFRLATIEAANPGFQSKLRSDIGSYVIHGFYERAMADIQGNNFYSPNKGKFIHEIFDNLQTELHEMGKQHPTYIWNDNTRYIRFKRKQNINENGDVNDVEMTKTQSAMHMVINNGEPEA